MFAESSPPQYQLDDRLLLRVDTAAQRLEISQATIKRLISSGELPSVKIGSARRIAVADLELYVSRIRGQRQGGQP